MRFDLELATPGTNQSAGRNGFIWVEVRPFRRACHLKVILSSHLQRDHFPSCSWGPTLYLYFFLYSLSFSCNIHLLSFVHTFLCILPCRIFSRRVVTQGFLVSEYPETVSCLWSLIKMLIFLFCLFISLSWLHHAACRFLSPQWG